MRGRSEAGWRCADLNEVGAASKRWAANKRACSLLRTQGVMPLFSSTVPAVTLEAFALAVPHPDQGELRLGAGRGQSPTRS